MLSSSKLKASSLPICNFQSVICIDCFPPSLILVLLMIWADTTYFIVFLQFLPHCSNTWDWWSEGLSCTNTVSERLVQSGIYSVGKGNILLKFSEDSWPASSEQFIVLCQKPEVQTEKDNYLTSGLKSEANYLLST